MAKDPKLVHTLLDHLAVNIAAYACYQIESGAEVIQLFDSWAGCLTASDYDVFAAPYQKKIIAAIKAKHPEIPTIIYVKQSGALLERLALVGANVVSLDWTVNMREARRRIDISKQTEKKGAALVGGRNRVNVQGNLDPALLFAPDDIIVEKTMSMIDEAGYRGHIANLGHGVDPATSEEKARLFVETIKNHKYVIKPKPFTLRKELKVQPEPNPNKKKSVKKKGF
jgi:uroporphyrinogen decarboxylase